MNTGKSDGLVKFSASFSFFLTDWISHHCCYGIFNTFPFIKRAKFEETENMATPATSLCHSIHFILSGSKSLRMEAVQGKQRDHFPSVSLTGLHLEQVAYASESFICVLLARFH